MPLVKDVGKAHDLALSLDAQRAVRQRIEELEVQRAALYAESMRQRAELARLSVERPSHAVMELAGTARIGQDKARRELEHGRRLAELLPEALELLEAGALRQGTVELLLWTTAKCTDEVLAEVGVRVTSLLVDCDAVDARALIAATVLEVQADLDPEAAERQHAQARANRGVWVKPVEDGMARIGAEVDAVSAQRFALDLEELTRTQGRADEAAGVQRTVEQRRADVLTDLPSKHLALLLAFQQGQTATDLLGGEAEVEQLWVLPVRAPVTLNVHIPMTTVLDLDNRSGFVEGLGPISAHQARLLRPIASLRALWVDCDTGVPLGIDPKVITPVGEPDWTDAEQVSTAAELVRERLRSMLRPTAIDDVAEPGRFASAALSRLVAVRDVRCTGPGCPLPARRCELDHLVAVAEGGQTAVWSLGLKSPRCHHARHDGWISHRLESGETVWLSPLGGRYTRRGPWRPPPRIGRSLPLASLDRPDGGLGRTFGADPDEQTPPEPVPEPEVADHGSVDRDEHPAAQHQTWFDVVGRPDPRPAESPPRWDRTWPTDDPPPF